MNFEEIRCCVACEKKFIFIVEMKFTKEISLVTNHFHEDDEES